MGRMFLLTAPSRIGRRNCSYKWILTILESHSSSVGILRPVTLTDQERWCCSRLFSLAFSWSDSRALSASSFFRTAFSAWVALRMVSMWASLVERLLMVVLDVVSCSLIASILAAIVLTLAVSASREPAGSDASTFFLGGMVQH